MTNEGARWFTGVDCGLPPHHACHPNPTSISAGERERLQGDACAGHAISFGIASTRLGRNSRGAAVRLVSALLGIPAVESTRELHPRHEEATPLPQWMSATRPNRAGMFIPGLLVALAVLAAANGILSAVLELVWL